MYLTTEAVRQFERSHLLTIHEREQDWDGEWEYAEEIGIDLIAEKRQELRAMQEELLTIIPQCFHAAILDGSINLPGLNPSLRNDYLIWQQQEAENFEKVLEAAYFNKQQALPYLQPGAREVFSESLHDATVWKVEKQGQDVSVYFDTTGGFTAKARVVLTFKNITYQRGEWFEGFWYVYDEIEKRDAGIAFQVTTDGPQEVYIECETIDAEFYYYPKAYYERQEGDTWARYRTLLDPQAHYYVITREGIQEIESIAEVDGLEIDHVFTNIYEDPYAHFSEAVPDEELLDAVFQGDMELRVRAWNTMYADAMRLAPIINVILEQLTPETEDEMLLYVFVRHFEQQGILSAANQKKYQNVLEE